MDAKRRNEGHADDGGIELPLVVWVDDETEPGRTQPDGPLPDAAASGEAASTEAPSAPATGKVGPVAELAEIAQVVAAGESALPVPTGVGADPGQVTEQGAEQQRKQQSEQAAEAGGEAAFSTSAEIAARAADAPDSGSAHHRRISRPMIAAAAISGVVLVGLSAVLAQMGGGSSGSPLNPGAALYPRATLGGGFTPGGAGVAGSIAASPAPGKGLPGKGATPGAVAGSHGSNHGAPSGNANGSGAAVGSGNGGSVATGSGHSGSTNSGTTTGGSTTGNGGSNPSGSTPTTPPPATFTAVGGPGCAEAGTSFQAWGWFDDGNSGYIAHDSGGLVGDGCSGAYNALPMSGEAGTDDTDNSMVWTFHTGAVSKGTCAISVYIPDISNVIEVGGDPSYYTVQGSSSPYTDTTGSFEVDQVSHRGDWVSVGTFPVSGGLIAVMLHSRGIDWTDSAATYAHHNADALEVSCTS